MIRRIHRAIIRARIRQLQKHRRAYEHAIFPHEATRPHVNSYEPAIVRAIKAEIERIDAKSDQLRSKLETT